MGQDRVTGNNEFYEVKYEESEPVANIFIAKIQNPSFWSKKKLL